MDRPQYAVDPTSLGGSKLPIVNVILPARMLPLNPEARGLPINE